MRTFLLVAFLVACRVDPKDGSDATVDSDVVPTDVGEDTDLDLPPTTPVVRLAPTPPGAGRDALRCEAVSGGLDPEGEAVTWSLAWTYAERGQEDVTPVSADGLAVDGDLPRDTIPRAALRTGRWSCTPTVTDGHHRVVGATVSVDSRPVDDLITSALRTCVLGVHGDLRCWGAGWSEPPPDVAWAAVSLGWKVGCGIRADDASLSCWSGDLVNPPEPVPTGAFDEVVVAMQFACALDRFGAAACWSLWMDVAAAAPPEVPLHGLALSSHGVSACALDARDRPRCWSGGWGVAPPQPDPRTADGAPDEPLEQVAVGYQGTRAYGLRLDGSLVAWPPRDWGVVLPDGPFVSLYAGARSVCALHVLGDAWCWQEPVVEEGVEVAPALAPHVVASGLTTMHLAGGELLCGREADGTAACAAIDGARHWYGQGVLPTERLTSLSVGGAVCGIDAAGLPVCLTSVGSVPAVVVDELVVGHARDVCAVRAVDGLPVCWGLHDRGLLDASAPTARVHGVAVGVDVACALDEDERPTCWHRDGRGVPDGWSEPPALALHGLVGASRAFCGLDAEGVAHCWGAKAIDATGRYTQLAASLDEICGLDTDGGVTCWPAQVNSFKAAPDPGPFEAIVRGGRTICGRRADQTHKCWGRTTSSAAWEADQAPGVLAPSIRGGELGFCGLDVAGRVWCNGVDQAVLRMPMLP